MAGQGCRFYAARCVRRCMHTCHAHTSCTRTGVPRHPPARDPRPVVAHMWHISRATASPPLELERSHRCVQWCSCAHVADVERFPPNSLVPYKALFV